MVGSSLEGESAVVLGCLVALSRSTSCAKEVFDRVLGEAFQDAVTVNEAAVGAPSLQTPSLLSPSPGNSSTGDFTGVVAVDGNANEKYAGEGEEDDGGRDSGEKSDLL